MPLTHEFGIIKDITEESYKSYAPEKSQCISVDDDIITNLIGPLSLMKTYFHSLHRPEYGLAYHGITIIPPESLPTFLDIVLSADEKQCDDLNILGQKIIQAKQENKYMIHYGI
ncbi:short-chain dehydrogenase [Solibacillus sp. FSL W7-1464]|uniref:short-chain dehydrogenase n=1 Tax=Solibacillus sp. FSL W7-1464 TaxID=2921706 RepID=UPI0030F7AD20